MEIHQFVIVQVNGDNPRPRYQVFAYHPGGPGMPGWYSLYGVARKESEVLLKAEVSNFGSSATTCWDTIQKIEKVLNAGD